MCRRPVPRLTNGSIVAKLRVLLVDDHAIVREGLRAVLAGDPEMDAVGGAADGIEACAQAASLSSFR